MVNTSVVLQPDHHGAFSLGRRRMVILPVGLRRRCGLASGEDVLMVADPMRGVLVAHPLHALDALILGYHASLAGGENSDQ